MRPWAAALGACIGSQGTLVKWLSGSVALGMSPQEGLGWLSGRESLPRGMQVAGAAFLDASGDEAAAPVAAPLTLLQRPAHAELAAGRASAAAARTSEQALEASSRRRSYPYSGGQIQACPYACMCSSQHSCRGALLPCTSCTYSVAQRAEPPARTMQGLLCSRMQPPVLASRLCQLGCARNR